MNIDMDVFFGPAGPIAGHLPGYECRREQIEMARAIAEAFKRQQHLVVEAGTGVGKSFAYLIPAISWALTHKKKVVVSTHTISLQEQLVQKDIPFVKEASGLEFQAVLAKGRSNYLCRRRLEQARRRGHTLFETSDDVEALERIYQWSLTSTDGTLSSLEWVPGSVWEMVCSDNTSCMGKRCRWFDVCFYQAARRKMYVADLIVVNHALLFSDLAVRRQGGRVLPEFEIVILDEAHNMENSASKHFGFQLSNLQVNFLLHRLFNPRTGKGILASRSEDAQLQLVQKAGEAAEQFYNEILKYYDSQSCSGGNGRVSAPESFANVLSGPLHALGIHLLDLAKEEQREDDKLELNSYGQRCLDLAAGVQQFVAQEMDAYVYWVEASRRYHGVRTVICASPLHIGPTLQEVLFARHDSVVLTSATLSTSSPQDIGKRQVTGQKGEKARGFEFFTSRLGLQDYQVLQLGSPFDYERQVKVFVEASLPDPREQEDEFILAAVEAIKHYLLQTQGKAFVLFTSFRQLRQAAEGLGEFCRYHGFRLLCQGGGIDRTTLLQRFREDTNSVLLGTDSFWQGVDVRGESLSNVIIVKLPFSVPDHPLLQARLEQIKAEGGSGFLEYQLPEALLKFKQGFGRLIRTRRDRGMVVILDRRVVSKRYGQAFLNVLPKCPVEIIQRDRQQQRKAEPGNETDSEAEPKTGIDTSRK